jgi:hypothetical protein
MRGVPGGGFPDCRALLYLARAVGRKLRVHGGCTWSTEHPSTEARHEEEDHQGNRRDSEVTVCAVRTFRPSYPSLRLHSYSSVLRPRIARRVQAKTLIHAFRLSANVGLELKFQEHERATTVRLPTNGADVWVAPMSGCVSQANERSTLCPGRPGICGRNDNVSLAFIFGRQPNRGSYGPRTLALADWDSPSDHLIDLAVWRFALASAEDCLIPVGVFQ